MKKVKVETPDGPIVLEVPEGKTSEDVLRGVFGDESFAPLSADEVKQQSIADTTKTLSSGLPGILASLGYGVGDAMMPGMKQVRGLVRNVAKGITGQVTPSEQLEAAAVERSPKAHAVGVALPDIARSVAGFSAGAGALGKIIPQANKATGLGKLLNIIRGAGIGSAANVGASQAVDPDVERLALDAALGGGFGAAGEIANVAKPAVKKVSANLYSSVLKRPKNLINAEAKRGTTLEEQMAERGMFGGTPSRLSQKAEKAVEKLDQQIEPLIDGVKAKVAPTSVIKRLEKLRTQFIGPKGVPVEGMGNHVMVIDDMINSVATNYGKSGWLTARQATDLKRQLYKMSKKVLATTETGPITKEAQMAQALGWKEGVEKAADKSAPELGKKIASLNKEQGFWLNLGNAADEAAARQGKTYFGKYVIPAALGGGGAALSSKNKRAGAGMMTAALALTPMGRLLMAAGLSRGSNIAPNMNKLAPLISILAGQGNDK